MKTKEKKTRFTKFSLPKFEVPKHTEFRVKCPRGELGALPDDAEQNIRLDFLENKVNSMEEKYSQ